MPIAQKNLNLTISQRTVLVTVDMVRAVLGVDADTVAGKVDAGELRWVWDVSVGQGDVRELRCWAKEIIAPEFTRNLTALAAVTQILGDGRARWRGTEVGQLLLVSRPHVMRLVDAGALRGEVVAGTLQVPRAALEHFLLTRLNT